MHRIYILALCLLVSAPLAAEVTDSSAAGFTSRNTASVQASPQEAYAKLVHGVAVWWSPDHTFSGTGANLRIEPRQGGCFCETLPNGGSVRHLEVVYADPGRVLRLVGGLGPLQATAATGAMTWELSAVENGTEITVTYTVGGYVPSGLDSWATGVDRVVAAQLQRLARYIDTGRPQQASAGTAADGGSSR